MTSRRATSARGVTLSSVIALITAVLISGCAFAQTSSTPKSSDSTPKWDFFAGYQFTAPGGTVPFTPSNPASPIRYALPNEARGGGSALTYNFDPHWGAEVDAGYSRDTQSASSEWTVSAGPRFMWRTDPGPNFFMHAQLAFNRVTYAAGQNDNNGIGAILGGGIDIPFSKMFAWRLIQADYVYARHNYAGYADSQFPSLRRPSLEGARLRTGIVVSWGGAPAIPPAAACSVQPTEVMVGEPITATATASNFDPKHTVTYSWSGNGGQVTGKDTTASIDTNNAAPGTYTVTAHVTDPKAKKANEATCTATYTIKPLPPKNPPSVSLSASPAELVPGGTVNLSASCTSPDGVPVSVANWTTSAGTVTGSGTSATLNTAGLPPGPITVNATCTDSRGLNAQATTQVTIQNPPPPPVDKALEARLALHSVYFPTAQPTPQKPEGGLLPGQQKVLINLATDFKKYLEAKPDAHITLEGHADHRGTVEFNQALTERRVGRVKSFLIEQGVPAGDIDTKALGKEHNLTTEEVKQSIEQNTELTTEERKRALSRITVIRMASNRRVDITLNSAGQTETSVRQFPFNAADALTLIGGRESEMKKTAKPAPKKKPVKKQ